MSRDGVQLVLIGRNVGRVAARVVQPTPLPQSEFGARTCAKGGASRIWNVYDRNYDEILTAALRGGLTHVELRPFLDAGPQEQQDEQNKRTRELLRRAIAGDWGLAPLAGTCDTFFQREWPGPVSVFSIDPPDLAILELDGSVAQVEPFERPPLTHTRLVVVGDHAAVPAALKHRVEAVVPSEEVEARLAAVVRTALSAKLGSAGGAPYGAAEGAAGHIA